MNTNDQKESQREPWPQEALDALTKHVSAECWMEHQTSDEAATRSKIDRHRIWGPLVVAPDCGNGQPAATIAAAIEKAIHDQCGEDDVRRRNPVITAANEPDEQLHENASMILDTVLPTKWDKTEYAEGAAFCIVDIPSNEEPADSIGRLRHAARTLDQEEGIMVMAMPKNQLHDVAEYLAQSWEIHQFLMPGDPERLIIFGTPADQGESTNAIQTRQENITSATPVELSTDNDDDYPMNYVYYERSRRTPAGLNAVWERNLSHRELVELASRRGSRHMAPYRKAAAGLEEEYGRVTNLAPLTAGHTMMLIAAGQLDNVAVIDPNSQHPPIIMKGNVKKVATRQDNTKTRYIKTENYSSSIRYMNLETGQIDQVNEEIPGELQNFFNQRKSGFQDTVRRIFPPRVDPVDDAWQEIRDNMARRIRGRQPIGKQTADAVTLAAHLTDHQVANLLGRPGSGKTFISLMTIAGLGCARIMVVCPTHVMTTWIDEITEVMPLARIRVCRKVKENRPKPPAAMAVAECDLKSAMNINDATPDRPLFIITPQGAASLAGRTRLTVRTVGGESNPGLFRTRRSRDPEKIDIEESRLDVTYEQVDTCPRCWIMLTGNRFYESHQSRRDLQCPQCKQPLREPDMPAIEKGKGIPTRSYPILDYVAKRCPNWHDLLVIDEVQQYKAQDTQRGEVIGRCAQLSKKVLTLTGTYIGGMASDAFYLLQRTRPGFGREFRWNQLASFITKYGRFRDVYEERKVNKRTKFRRTSHREVPGYHPMLLSFLMDNSVFTTLADLKRSLPPEDPRHNLPAPESIPVLLPLASEPMPGDTMSQEAWYQELERTVTGYAINAMSNHRRDKWNVGVTKQALMTGPENCWKQENILDPKGDSPSILPVLSSRNLYPKEQAMVEITTAERDQGRRFLIYCTHTKTRSVVERTLGVLQGAGLEVIYMDPDKVKAEERLDWFKSNARNCDGIIVHPSSVSTGLNLTEFPTIIWQEVSESAITADQASSRSDRINQTEAVRVYYLAYRETMQHDALSLLAAKADAGRSIYGELAKNGLSFMNPMADRFDDIIENELHRELERVQADNVDNLARQALALVQIRQDDAGLREMLKSNEHEHEDTMLVNQIKNWSRNIKVDRHNTASGRSSSRRRPPPTGVPDRPTQMTLI